LAKRLSVIDIDHCVGCQSCMFACTRRTGQGGLEESRIHVQSAGGFSHGFVVIVCRACFDPPCARVCPTDALVPREGGGVQFHTSKCIGCHNCQTACPFGAALWDDTKGKPRICVYCGYCARYCPYEVIALEEISEDQETARPIPDPEAKPAT
jgi:anaerobic carbon-monoxide dehydrogenase iron sulfur subunit